MENSWCDKRFRERLEAPDPLREPRMPFRFHAPTDTDSGIPAFDALLRRKSAFLKGALVALAPVDLPEGPRLLGLVVVHPGFAVGYFCDPATGDVFPARQVEGQAWSDVTGWRPTGLKASAPSA